MNRNFVAFSAAALLFGGHVSAQSTPPTDAATKKIEVKKPDYSPYPDQHFPNRVFWGVAHVHTGYSFDSGMFGVTADPRRPLQGCHGRGSRPRQRPALQTGPAAGLGLHHRPCRVYGHRRSDSRRQPRAARQPTGQALVRDVQDEPSGGCQSRHRSGRLHADRQACLRRQQAHGRGLGARYRGSREVEPAGRFHHAARLRVDLRARRQQPSSHRRFPRQRGPREPDRSLFHLRQPGSGRAVEVHGRVREEDRRPGARHPAQRQPEQWP